VHGNRSPLPLRRITTSLLLLVAMMAPLPTLAASTDLGISPTITAADLDTWDGMRAGVGIADATWNVGAAAGQYSDIRQPQNELEGETDPHLHATAKKHSYGVQSRLTIRAIVVEGTNGERVALVKSDNYLAQDHLLRRVGQLLGDAGSQVTYDGILHAASHNHSSPYYATPSWGVWLFQDVVDLRMFEYQARSMADAILEAEASLAPARMGATVVHHNVYKGNIMRPKTAVDGSPAGFPNDYGDKELTVLRFDTLTQDGWDPLAVWMNWGQHPESLDSYDLITADFLAPLERYVDRETGAMLVFSQGDVGSAEGPYVGWHRGRLHDGTLVAWAHVGHAQTERGARILSDSVIEAFDIIGAGGGTVPYDTHIEVAAINGFVPGPVSHPYPAVSNCRTKETVEGDPGVPILGLPDCARSGGMSEFDPVFSPVGAAIDNLRAHGIPVPDHYDASSFTGVQENLRIRLQVIRLGEVVLGSCACEAQVDMIKNFKSRANNVVGDLHAGFDWATDPHTTCTPAEDGQWACVYNNPEARGARSWTFDDTAYQRWQAQVHNPADGWDDLAYAPFANSEPDDPAAIKGNFSTEELDEGTGYALVVGVGHAGDYNGYTVSYREYMAYDHYRKALTSHGPHTADYMVTWMVRMARDLNDADYSWEEELAFHDPTSLARLAADEVRQVATSQALGRAAGAAYDAWQAALPADVGPAEILDQPTDIARFDATTLAWRGGSNAVDNPDVRVERLVDGAWEPFADMTGEIQTMVELPQGLNGVLDTYTGGQEWIWTANLEAFTGGPDPRVGATPAGTYRFVVDGHIRQGLDTQAYHLTSEPFEVAPWDGITAPTLALDGGTATVTVPDRHVYPRTYTSDFPFVADDGRGRLVDADGNPVPDDFQVCRTCSFRPWAFEGEVAQVTLTITRPGGQQEHVAMEHVAPDTWQADDLTLRPNDQVQVLAGGVVDGGGNINGQPSNTVAVAPGPPTGVGGGNGGPGGPGGSGGGPDGPDATSVDSAPASTPASGTGLVVAALVLALLAAAILATRRLVGGSAIR
jgi:hypothetical protein